MFLFTPCWDEPFGLVAIEAMACGLPVASLDIAGRPARSSPRRASFAPADDAAMLAAAIPSRPWPLAVDVPRKRVIELFTRDIWLDGCERLYHEARHGMARPVPGVEVYQP